MPKLELKTVQRELEQGIVWPFYWIYGTERLKARELLKRIKKVVLESAEGADDSTSLGVSSKSFFGWNEQILDGHEVSVESVLDCAQSMTLGGGVKLIIVRDAHALKNSDLLAELLGPAQPKSELTSVCVCLSKDLDGRKKFSKVLIEQAAVVSCEEVPDNQRESWILYLAKRRDMELPPSLVVQLCTLDPWSLDIIDQELEKLSISDSDPDVTLEGTYLGKISDLFVESFFSRDLKTSLAQLLHFADSPDETLPLLGLLGWNVRQMSVLLSDRELGTRYSKMSSFWMDRLRKWSQHWNLAEMVHLQNELVELDYHTKQTPLMPLGLWNQLVIQFCFN